MTDAATGPSTPRRNRPRSPSLDMERALVPYNPKTSAADDGKRPYISVNEADHKRVNVADTPVRFSKKFQRTISFRQSEVQPADPEHLREQIRWFKERARARQAPPPPARSQTVPPESPPLSSPPASSDAPLMRSPSAQLAATQTQAEGSDLSVPSFPCVELHPAPGAGPKEGPTYDGSAPGFMPSSTLREHMEKYCSGGNMPVVSSSPSTVSTQREIVSPTPRRSISKTSFFIDEIIALQRYPHAIYPSRQR